MELEALFVLVAASLVAVLAAVLFLADRVLHICRPNEVLIVSGRRRAGCRYRVVHGGRAWRVPLIERVDRLDLGNMIIEAKVDDGYSRGGVPLTVECVANVKIGGRAPLVDEAIERLLDMARGEVAGIAAELLEGNLRGVLAGLTPEEAHEDKRGFGAKVAATAAADLARLGLALDTLKIQNVGDARGYLESIGRRSTAELMKRSRTAEARESARTRIERAAQRQGAQVAAIESEEATNVAEGERRIGEARTRARAMIAEARGQVQVAIAGTTAAIEAEGARAEQTRLRLAADVVEPATAALDAAVRHASGRAAEILEGGRATVQVLEAMVEVWRRGGEHARDVFVMQKLQPVLEGLASTLDEVKVSRVTVLAQEREPRAAQAVHLVEVLRSALGDDLRALAGAVVARGRDVGRASD